MTPAERLRQLANQFGHGGDDPEDAATFIRLELATTNFFKVDAETTNAILEEWERAPETVAAREAEAAALAEVNSSAPTWERISDGLDEESLVDLARMVTWRRCFRYDPYSEEEPQESLDLCGSGCPCVWSGKPFRCPVTLDHIRGVALVGSDPGNPRLILRWNGDKFVPHTAASDPLTPPTPITIEEFRALSKLNTPKAIWARIADGRSEAEMHALAERAAKRTYGRDDHGAVTLDHTTGSACVAAFNGFKAYMLRWDGYEFVYYRAKHGPLPCFLRTFKDLWDLAAEPSENL